MLKSAAFLIFLTTAAYAGTATLIPVPPVDGGRVTTVWDINDNNVIAGSYYTPDGIEHGYFGTLDGQYTKFDFGVSYTEPRGISNSGYVIGIADDSEGDFGQFERRPDGLIKLISKAGLPLADGVLGGINSKDEFVGNGLLAGVNGWHSYIGKNWKYGKEIALQHGGLSYAEYKDINDAGVIVGDVARKSGARVGVIVQKGEDDKIIVPDKNASDTFILGINNNGTAAGDWHEPNGEVHAFEYDNATGVYTAIKPNAPITQAFGINNVGLVAFNLNGKPYIYCPNKKKCPSAGGTSIEIATSTYTTPSTRPRLANRPNRLSHKSKTFPGWIFGENSPK